MSCVRERLELLSLRTAGSDDCYAVLGGEFVIFKEEYFAFATHASVQQGAGAP